MPAPPISSPLLSPCHRRIPSPTRMGAVWVSGLFFTTQHIPEVVQNSLTGSLYFRLNYCAPGPCEGPGNESKCKIHVIFFFKLNPKIRKKFGISSWPLLITVSGQASATRGH